MKYKYSRKEIAKVLHSILQFGESRDFPTLWSEINQIKLNLLTITLPQEEKKECKHKIKEFVGVNIASCKKCGCLFVSPFKDMPTSPSIPEFEEIKPAKKIVTYSGSERYPNLKELWEKQCEIIDTLKKLIKQK